MMALIDEMSKPKLIGHQLSALFIGGLYSQHPTNSGYDGNEVSILYLRHYQPHDGICYIS